MGTGLMLSLGIRAQYIPVDTAHWDIQGSYVMERFRGADAIYLKAGAITLKDVDFLNGTIEFDLFLKKEQAFPGVNFRAQENGNSEEFYVRPHQSGNPDANQAAPSVQNITPWQLCYGPRYSFPYEYRYDDWTHIRILVNGRKAQVFMDHSETPNLSWDLFHQPKAGRVIFRGGNASGIHLANISVSHDAPELVNFQPIVREPIANLIPEWEVSDMFEESLLSEVDQLDQVIVSRKWGRKIQVEEGTAANISRVQNLFNGEPGNTVFAKIVIHSSTDQIKLFEFGYSDRVVAVLNGKPIYWGTNRWRSRDYRYLGTIGLFDGIYLDLKAGENTLLMAVSEDFGGWLITGRFQDPNGITFK